MQIDGNKPIKSTLGQKIKKPAVKVKDAVMKAVDVVDKYTSPREDTAGGLKKASYFQACLNGVTEGFYTMGLPGTIIGAVPAAVGVTVTRKTDNTVIGVLAGIGSGAATGAAVGALTGNPAGIIGCTIAGGVIGAMQTFRGDPDSRTRDAGGNANMISAVWIPGTGKMAAGIGSAMGSKMKSKTAKAAVGAAVAGTVGGALALVGFAPVAVPVAVAASAIGGAIGPFLGPRFSQFFRNLASDAGRGVEKLGKKMGLFKEDSDNAKRTQNSIGTIPASFLKEGIRGMALSDGDPVKMLVGGVMDVVSQAHIFITQKMGSDDNKNAVDNSVKPSEAKANTEGEIADKMATKKSNDE